MATANNSISDARYKIILRMDAEIDKTDWTQAPDNPRNLSVADVAAFAAYRRAWWLIGENIPSDDLSIDFNSEMLVSGFVPPDLPTDWVWVSRAIGDLPPILIKKNQLDTYDPTTVGVIIT
jgi:hypothetical protein